ncbi:MAG TPA: amidophosphoribosyltransferase [Polyangiaceae bacterium]|nr:amidophosphoribosyltransferase [Polyangiaceae bacterium]
MLFFHETMAFRPRDDYMEPYMCGVFGVYGHTEAAKLTYLGLHALQHRGQESAGIISADGGRLFAHRAMGPVHDSFTPTNLTGLPGESSIGHVRYSTAGGSHIKNAQPLAVDYARGSIAIAHNGNLTNAEELREKLEARGSIFQSNSDTEVIIHLLAMSTQRLVEDRIADALSQVEGAYSLVFLTGEALIAVRDPKGIRPLVLGSLPGSSVPNVVASEPVAFDLIDAKTVREVAPGEMIVIDKSGLRSSSPLASAARNSCVFEYVYFARPDSKLSGATVYEVRKNLGRKLAEEEPADCDIVIPVPDSGVPAAMGYAERAGVPFELGLIRSHYVGRTFIEPSQAIRHFGVRLKLNPVSDTLRGKRVVVIDDSIVRGTTSRKIVKMVRDAGAKEIHMRISSPPIRWPCYYGIDTPTRSELVASSHTNDEISRYITSDSLGYLSIEGMLGAVTGTPGFERNGREFCHACFSGEYPIQVATPVKGRQLPLLMV